MFSCVVNGQTEMRLIELQQSRALFALFDSNRAYLRRWHPWVDQMRSADIVEKTVMGWQQQQARNQGFFAGIWFQGKLCGVVNHVHVDWASRWTALSYWLDEAHQGRGIMTACCRTLVSHSFTEWKLNRVTIECATGNLRSRAIPERLGFKLDGIIRGIERLHDGYVDHAMYGLLSSDTHPVCEGAGVMRRGLTPEVSMRSLGE